jgi:hypothetical protein
MYFDLAIQVDIMKVDRIQAFCSSDEDNSDWENRQLVFLPCTPDVEDPEDSRGASGFESPVGGGSDNGRDCPTTSAQKSTRRRRTKVHDVPLEDPPLHGTVSLLVMNMISFGCYLGLTTGRTRNIREFREYFRVDRF